MRKCVGILADTAAMQRQVFYSQEPSRMCSARFGAPILQIHSLFLLFPNVPNKYLANEYYLESHRVLELIRASHERDMLLDLSRNNRVRNHIFRETTLVLRWPRLAMLLSTMFLQFSRESIP